MGNAHVRFEERAGETYRTQVWRRAPVRLYQERFNKEIRCRTDVAGIFPNREALLRLVGAGVAEQHDEWAAIKSYMEPEQLQAAQRVCDDKSDALTLTR